MTVPFELLREELVRAAARGGPRRSRRWLTRLRGGRRSLTLVAAAVVVSGSATAAVISLSTMHSQPLAGTVPGRGLHSALLPPESLAGDQYQISVTPELTAGGVGWCTTIRYTYRGKPGTAAGSCGSDYPSASAPLFGPEASSFGYSAPAPQVGDTVHYLLTAPDVAYVRVGRVTIPVRHDSALPAGDGVVVFFLPATSPPVMVPPAGAHAPYYMPIFVPPHSSRSGMPAWMPSKSGLQRVPMTPAIALDRYGHELPFKPGAGYGVFSRWWQRPQRQPLGSCQLRIHRSPGLTAQWGHVIYRIKPVRDVQGAAFLSCLSIEYYLHHWGLTVAVLLNAGHPGEPVGPLPGMQPVAANPGLLTAAHGSVFGAITARRVGDAWLVVQGGADLAPAS